jgi:replicative DNA helicase
MPPITLDLQFPPTAIQAEQILLGRLILAGVNALTEIGALTPDQFADSLHGSLYRVVVQRVEAEQPIDAKALADEAERSGILDDVGGGASYLQQLLAAARDPLSLSEAADLVRTAWALRQAVPDNAGTAIPDLRDHRADYQHPAHVTLGAIELETLADHHDAMAAGMHRGDSGSADLMAARAAELRRWATRARAVA